MKAKDSVWYKSSMDKGGVPSCPPGMDTDAKWGYNHTKKGWIFGYKLYLTCTEAIYELVVPLYQLAQVC